MGPTWDRRPFSYTGLPRPTGYTLVSCRPTIATDFRDCLLRFIPPPLRLLHRSGSTMVLTHTGVISVLRLPSSTSATRHLDFAVVSQSFGVTGSFGPTDSVWTSTSPGIIAGSWAQSTTLTPLSITAAVGHLPHGSLMLGSRWSSVPLWIPPPPTLS